MNTETRNIKGMILWFTLRRDNIISEKPYIYMWTVRAINTD